MKPFVTVCFTIFVVCFGFSQNIKTDLNIQAYGNVLIQSKKQYINIDSIIHEILAVQNMSETRYAEIIKSEFEGDKAEYCYINSESNLSLDESIITNFQSIAKEKLDKTLSKIDGDENRVKSYFEQKKALHEIREIVKKVNKL